MGQKFHGDIVSLAEKRRRHHRFTEVQTMFQLRLPCWLYERILASILRVSVAVL